MLELLFDIANVIDIFTGEVTRIILKLYLCLCYIILGNPQRLKTCYTQTCMYFTCFITYSIRAILRTPLCNVDFFWEQI